MDEAAGDRVTERLRRRIRADFPEPGAAEEVAGALRDLADRLGAGGVRGAAAERLAAAVVLLGCGDARRVRSAVALALTDWRDLLMAAGLGGADWPALLDAELGAP
ncbi:hypothetical protein [Streptomyces sp. cmx-4-9]|uniref:hypothetical protein n=1 Tax=Streptomyces sp. cmx-4-9 TaxID=2790941 RepID=UPI0039807316